MTEEEQRALHDRWGGHPIPVPRRLVERCVQLLLLIEVVSESEPNRTEASEALQALRELRR